MNNYLVDIEIEGMELSDIQEFYDRLCKKYNKLSVKAYFVHDNNMSQKLTGRILDYKGLYVEWPFRKIYLDSFKIELRTIYHEIFHHLNPHLNDGPEFEKLLDKFIETEYL